MKALIIFSAFSCLLLSSSCEEFRYRYSIEELLGPLEKEFHCKIPNGLQILVLIPSNNCKNCIFLDYLKFTPEERNRTQIFSYLPIHHFMGFPNFHYDKKDQLIRIRVLRRTNFILVLRNRQLLKAIPTAGVEQELDKVMRLYGDCCYGGVRISNQKIISS